MQNVNAQVGNYQLTAEFVEVRRSKRVWFSLLARVANAERDLQSRVTNVNGIAGELANAAKITPARLEQLMEDGTWDITRSQAERLQTFFEELRDQRDETRGTLGWLIDALDADRGAGEWGFPSDAIAKDADERNGDYPRFVLDPLGRVSCPHCGGIGFDDVGDGDLRCQHCNRYCTTLLPPPECTPRQRFVAIIKIGVDISTARNHSGEPIEDDADLSDYVRSELGWAQESFDEFEVDVMRA